MIVAITGASGFIGRYLGDRLRAAGHTIRPLSTRNAPRAADFAGCRAVVNLAGEPVAQRWTPEARERIRHSRVEGTRALVETLRVNPPAVLVNASAIGYYGDRGDEILTESSAPATDFLGRVSFDWEREALAAESFGVRVVTPRIAVVLGRTGGALAKMLLPFRMGAGGRIGNGRQWMSWIHLDDLASMMMFAIDQPVRGAMNASAPNPVTNAEFTRALAATLHRPAIFPVPRVALKMMFGEMAEIIYASQRVMPEAALGAGFKFRFPEIRAAFEDLL